MRSGRATGRARMADVAARAGVSAITVSRALRDPDKVSAEARSRIAAAVEELAYVPNLVAGSLASNQSRIIAAVVPTIGGTIFAETVRGMSDELRAKGYQLLIGDSGYSADEEDALVSAFLGRRPDGMALTGVHHKPAVRRRLRAAGLPVVEIWDLTESPIDIVVGFSNYRAGYDMTAYLIGRGYRQIAFIGGRTFGDRRSAERRRGYEAALADHGREPGRSMIVTRSIEFRTGGEALARLLAERPETDCVFCSSDVLAVGALLECQRRGWKVPDRIAIAGLGDFGIAAEMTPPLTTVRIPGYEIGRRAAELLLARLAGETPSGRVVDLGMEIAARGST